MKYQAAVSLLVMLLSACATNNIQSTRINASSPLASGQGVVVVQVINNTDRLARLHKGWTEVIAVRTDNMEQIKAAAIAKAKAQGKSVDPAKVDWDPDIYSLSSLPEGVIDSQLFVGSMPKGKYVISSLYSFFSNGDVSSWLSMPVFQLAGTFSIEEHKLTDLGSVVFQPLLNVKEKSFWSTKSSQKAYVTRMSEYTSHGKFVADHYPQLAQNLDSNAPLGWDDDPLTDFRASLSQLSRENAYASHAQPLSNSDTVALMAKFGQLRLRDIQGQWQQFDLPTTSQLSAVLLENNQLVVGSELGKVFISELPVQNWLEFQPVAATEAIIWFGRDGETLFALTSSKRSYYAYVVTDLRSNWTRIGTFQKKNPNDWLVQNGGLFPLIKHQGGLRVINDNKKYDYQLSTQSWLNSKTTSLVNMTQAKDGTLLGLEVSQWDGIGDQLISTDDGDNWQTLSRNLLIFGDNKSDASLPVILDDGTIVSLGRAKTSKQKSQLSLISRASGHKGGGQDWTVHQPAKDNCYTMLPDLTQGQRVFFLCDQGQIVSTADFGQNWQTEVAVDIPEMQSRYEALVEAIKQSDTANKTE